MAVWLCSINDKEWQVGKVYCTTMRPMNGYERIECLCPTKELVYGHKYGGKPNEWYINGYRALIASKWPLVKEWLSSLREDEDITLLCYCKYGVFCHRKLMAKMIARHRPDIDVILH